MVRYISEEAVRLIHRIVILSSDVTPGYVNKGMISTCVERMGLGVYQTVPYQNIFTKPAALLHCIIVFHPFC